MLALSQNFESCCYIIEENFLTDFTADKINKLASLIKKQKNSYEHKLQQIERKLLSSGIDVQKIKKDAEIAAKKSNTKNGKSSNLKESIKIFAKDLVNKKYLINNDENQIQTKQSAEIEPTSIAGGILKSIGILAVVVFINTYLLGVATAITGSKLIGGIFLGVVVAPFVEEAGKLISVKHNFTWEYFTIFNLYEFTYYVFSLMSQLSISPIAAILMRLPAVAMHLFNTIVHVNAKERDDSETGYKISIAIHSIFNALGLVISLKTM